MAKMIRSSMWLLRILFLLTLSTLGPAQTAQARQERSTLRVLDDSTLVQEINLRDGMQIRGRIVVIDGDRITVRTLGGIDIDLMRRDVAKVRELQGFWSDGDFWKRDAADSRLFVFPTARVAPHGGVYLGVYELIIPSVGVGIGGIAMLSAGMSLAPWLALEDQAFYIAPKLQLFDVQYVQASVGAIWIRPGESEESAAGGLAAITAGTPLASVTAGLAFPLYRQANSERPAVYSLGGELRINSNVKLINENWIMPDEATVIALGARIFAGSLIAELAAVTTTHEDFIFPLVNISFVW